MKELEERVAYISGHKDFKFRHSNSTFQGKNGHETRMVIGIIAFSIALLAQIESLDLEWPRESGLEIGETTGQFALP